MSCNLPQEKCSKYNLSDILVYMRSLSEVQKTLLSDFFTLLSLILVMPATNSVSEQSFSSLSEKLFAGNNDTSQTE